MSESPNPLGSLRAEIAALDAKLLQLLQTRLECAKKIGSLKSKMGLPIKDYTVEKQIIEKSRSKAREMGLDSDFVETCMRAIIDASVAAQENLQSERRGKSVLNAGAVLVIGGAGNMGNWFCQFFASFQQPVRIADPALRPGTTHNGNLCVALEDGLTWADMIIIATPLAATLSVLKQLLNLRPKGLMVEIASLKSHLRPVLEQFKQQGLRLASIHPMFGPSALSLAGRNILICEAEFLDPAPELAALLTATSAHIQTLAFDQHDAVMSYILGASHLSNLVFNAVLTRSSYSAHELLNCSGTTFLQQLQLSQNVANENSDLYFDIQTLNPGSAKLYDEFERSLEDFKRSISTNDRQSFKNLMKGL